MIRLLPARLSARLPRALAPLFAAASLALALGCGGDDDDQTSASGAASTYASASASAAASSSTSGAGGGSDAFSIAGTLTYEDVPYDTVNEGLNYGAMAKRPIRGAAVHLLRADDDSEIAVTTTDDAGAYSFAYDFTSRVKLWVYAETLDPPIRVEDNTSKDAIYVMETAEIENTGAATFDAVATAGWGGQSYTGPRLAAPFAILDVAYTAARRFMAEASPAPEFPPLAINWSVDNRPEEGDVDKGEIGTSYWDDEELYILGKADIDTDEYDSHVIAHEWGHYFETMIARTDNPGGNHGYGDILDPRVAFSEGFCNALSAMVLDPDFFYTDASGQMQSGGFHEDLEENDISPASSPGWFSEETLQSFIFDLYDGSNEPYDNVSLGLGPVYGAMIGGHKDTEAFTTVFSFITALKAEGGVDQAALAELTAHHTINASFGMNDITSDWADGETHTGGVAGSLPLYKSGAIGSSYSVTLKGAPEWNALSQNHFIKFVGDGLPVTIKSACPEDVDLYVHQRGAIVDLAETLSGDEIVTFDTKSGEIYILNVVGYYDAEVAYKVDIDIIH